jgi:hypothetical protein
MTDEKVNDSDLFDGIAPAASLDLDVSSLKAPLKALFASLHNDLGKGLDTISAPLDFGSADGLLAEIDDLFNGLDDSVDDFFATFPTYLLLTCLPI